VSICDMTYGEAHDVHRSLMTSDNVTLSDVIGALANAMKRIADLEQRFANVRQTARFAAHTVSQLANGIKPD